MANIKKKTRKLSLGNTMKNYPDKSCEYVIPNRKSLKKWIKLENFHFIHWNFSFFWDMDYVKIWKTAKHLALKKKARSCRNNNFRCLFLFSIKAKIIGTKNKIFIFSLNFRQICWDMDDGKTLRNADNWALGKLWKNTQINPLNLTFLTQKLWKIRLIFENFQFFH